LPQNLFLKTLPEALLKDLRAIKNFDEAAFISAHQLPPVTSLRLNPAKEIGLFPDQQRVPWCAGGVYLRERPVFTLDPAYHAGAYYVQEASSMFLGHLLKSMIRGNNLRVLDLCAAPGGKSTLIASLLDKDSLLICNEVIRARASILDENMARWGHTNTWVAGNDPRDFGRLTGYFDVIVVDAPCSGSGLFRKDAHALGEWSEANVQLCSGRQQRILADVWPALKEDGILIYATCSYSPQEDEEILDWLAAEYNVTPLAVDIPETWGMTRVSTAKNMAGYRFFPDKVNGEGFFIAALQKNEEEEATKPIRFKSAHNKRIQEQAGYLLNDDDFSFIGFGKDDFCAIRAAHEPDLQLLQKYVYLRNTGLKLGVPAAKEWLPAHEVALAIDANTRIPGVNVTREQALRFLKKEEMGISDIEKGWHIIRYEGLGLGWIKSLGNRVNNYLPKHWRIRMDIND
jgi:16S rRNA C967 or C1407 C5-methylase (RsmB/RsmF family)/NOL1/NOP2/fmu family ribosome biogenesis protein